MSAVPTKSGPFKNENVRCSGKSVIRDDHNIPILDEDGARQYKPCLNWAANKTHLCAKHGGALEPTIKKAQRRLAYGSSDLVEILERIAKDERQPASERIKAINSYLDRAGIRAGVEMSLEVPKWQNVLGKLFGSPESDEPETDEIAPPPVPEETSVEPPVKRARKASPKKATKAPPPERPTFQGW